MGKLRLAALAACGTLAASAMQCAVAPTAPAAPCQDAEVIFARGTTEDPGPGPTGDAFITALRTQIGAKTLGVYSVDYPAAMEFSTALQGIADARQHILATAASCPGTKMVLGGFSQGAAVMGFVTASEVPDGVSPLDVPAPMPVEVADHVASVVLFGTPSTRFMKAIRDPSVVVGPNYAAKSIDLCVDNDLVCDLQGRSFSAHNTYAEAGLVDQGATFAAQRLQASWAADAATAPAAASTASPVPTSSPLSAQLPGSPLPQHIGTAPEGLPGPAPLPGPAQEPVPAPVSPLA